MDSDKKALAQILRGLVGPRYAWFSARAAETYGTAFYSKLDGSEVECTTVGRSPSEPPSCFGDEVALGLVQQFVRKGRPARAREQRAPSEGEA